MVRCILVLSVCGLMLAPALGVGDKDKAQKPAKEMKFEGSVADNDPAVKLGDIELHAKTHEVKLSAGKKYLIDLIKKDGDIDPFLIVQDKDGKTLAHDDDGGEDLNSRLTFSCLKDGSYKIFAAALSGTGGYTLTLKEVPLSADEKKVHAVGAAGLKLTGKLDQNARSFTYQVKFEAGKTYVIDMTTPDQDSLDPFLRLFGPDGAMLAEDDDGGEGLNSRITHQAEKAGTYRIVALPLSGNGDFTLEVREKQ